VASWNAANDDKKGTGKARLRLHRIAPDRAGEKTPWQQLGDLDAIKRPLLVVYDESHGQTDAQFDQLFELTPVGILAASGTPSISPKVDAYSKALAGSVIFGPIAAKALVEVPTSAVAAAGLLKTIIDLDDLNADDASRVKAACDKLDAIQQLARDNAITLRPRAIFVVEESNTRAKAVGDARPTILWNLLTQRCGVRPSDIAVATNTKELPKHAVKITRLDQLMPRHRYLIFNKKFSEGWDDPEAYVAYFDGETKSALRIKQIIGRIIRQPNAQPFEGLPDLNSAFIFVSAPDEKFAGIVEDIRSHLIDDYGSDASGKAHIEVRAGGKLRPSSVQLRSEAKGLGLPKLVLAVKNLGAAFDDIASEGQREWPAKDREAPGVATKRAFNLTEKEKKITARTVKIGQHIRANNGDYFLDRVRALSNRAFQALGDNRVTGPMFEQDSATLSRAQEGLRTMAAKYVDAFEERVSYTVEPDPAKSAWEPRPLEPTQPANLHFARSLHEAYPEYAAFLNTDEKAMCAALDATGDGWWMRNPPTEALGGYGVPMPVKVAGSENFYPDFLWWVDDTCFAIDTTGVHILPAKVRGKLLDVGYPKIALVVRGRVAESFDSSDESQGGWTLMLRGAAGPRRVFFPDIDQLLVHLRAEAAPH
jgi:type III restriction enzyme